MPPVKAVRVKTATGWQDIALVGPVGPQGPQGAVGPVGPPTPMVPMADDKFPSVKQPGSAGTSAAFTSSWELYGVSLGDMRQAITPATKVWWEVEAWCIVQVLEAVWHRINFQIWNDLGGPADALGQVNGPTTIHVSHSALVWQTCRCKALYKVNAGAAMNVRPVLVCSSGTWTTYHNDTSTRYCGSSQKVVGYW
jgi:hypothetical protein